MGFVISNSDPKVEGGYFDPFICPSVPDIRGGEGGGV